MNNGEVAGLSIILISLFIFFMFIFYLIWKEKEEDKLDKIKKNSEYIEKENEVKNSIFSIIIEKLPPQHITTGLMYQGTGGMSSKIIYKFLIQSTWHNQLEILTVSESDYYTYSVGEKIVTKADEEKQKEILTDFIIKNQLDKLD